MCYIQHMEFIEQQYDFSSEKNQQLILERGISFEDVIAAINNHRLLDVIDHHNKTKYAHQRIYVVNINNYVYLVPFVEKDNQMVFLKTIFPSRKITKHYLGEAL